MNSLRIKSLLAATLLATPMLTLAGAVYQVNRTIGSGSVIGTIETDGTIGVLKKANVIGWSLAIRVGDPSNPVTLFAPGDPSNPPNSVFEVDGDLLSATINALLFDFDFVIGASGYALFAESFFGSGQSYWCLERTPANICTGRPAESVMRVGEGSAFVDRSGEVAIGEIASVPEPASAALFGIALAGLAAARRQQRV